MEAQVDATPTTAPPKPPKAPEAHPVGLEAWFVVEVEDTRAGAPMTQGGRDGGR